MHCALCCRTIVFSPGINQLREAFRKTADKGLSLTRPRLAFFLLSLLDIAPNKVVGYFIQRRWGNNVTKYLCTMHNLVKEDF